MLILKIKKTSRYLDRQYAIIENSENCVNYVTSFILLNKIFMLHTATDTSSPNRSFAHSKEFFSFGCALVYQKN